MARYRKIDPRIWNDAKFRSLSDQGKLVFFMLLTHPAMTALGAMRASLPGLATELGWSSEGFAVAFREVSAKGMAEHDERACLVAIPRFLKYNPPESPNVVKAWLGSVDLLPECRLKTLVLQRAEEFAEGMSDGFRKAFQEVFAKTMPIQEQEQEQEQEEAVSLRSAMSSATPSDRAGSRLSKAERLSTVTAEAIEAFNRILAKPNGELASVRATVGRAKREAQVRRCLRAAAEICADQYGSPTVTLAFWEAYFTEVSRDDFHAGRVHGGRGHEGWRPDFEYLTRLEVMLKVFDRAMSEDA